MKRIFHCFWLLSISIFLFGQNEKILDEKIEIYQSKIDSINFEIEKLEQQLEGYYSLIKEEEKRLKFLSIGKNSKNDGIEVKAKVKYDFGRIILKKSPEGEEIVKIPKNSKIVIYSKIDGYYRIKYKEYTGYVLAAYLKIDPEVEKSFDNTEGYQLKENAFGQSLENQHNDYNFSNSTNKKKSLDYSKPVHVDGHYRTLKSGKKVWVRTHTRNRPRN